MPDTLVLQMAVGLDPAALVDLDAGFLQAKTVGIGAAPGGDQHRIGFDGLGGTALDRLEGDGRALLGLGDACHLGAELELETLFRQQPLELLGDLAIHAAEDGVEELDHGHLGAEPCPHRAELEPDDAAADHHQMAGNFLQRQRAGR